MQPLIHSDEPIIETKDLSFSYGNTKVLEDINLVIHKGDYLGIIGPNGGGKTTLLKLMLGLLKPQKGQIILHSNQIGYVPQKAVNFDANFPATVWEVVSMGRYGKIGLFRYLGPKDKEIISKALEQVGMTNYKNRLIGDLSGGQQQRVFIARALVTNPQIIFLDEPTVGVDIKAQEDFYKLLEKLNRELRLTLILVSHDIDVVTNEATEVACINCKLVCHLKPKEFISSDYIKKLYGKDIKFIVHGH